MNFIDKIKNLINQKPEKSATIAKERLQIIINHERSQSKGPDFLPELQRELVAVLAKYIDIDPEKVRVQLERCGENDVLELVVPIPEEVVE